MLGALTARAHIVTLGEGRGEGQATNDTDPHTQYLYALDYIDAPAQRIRDADTNGSTDDTLFYLHDANYTIAALVDDSSNTVTERYAYTPYGQRTVLDSDFSTDGDGVSDYINNIGHQGLLIDTDTNLIQNRNRTLHPTLGRFLQRDPMEYVDGMSLYQYIGSMTTDTFDPSGLKFKKKEIKDFEAEERVVKYPQYGQTEGDTIDLAARGQVKQWWYHDKLGRREFYVGPQRDYSDDGTAKIANCSKLELSGTFVVITLIRPNSHSTWVHGATGANADLDRDWTKGHEKNHRDTWLEEKFVGLGNGSFWYQIQRLNKYDGKTFSSPDDLEKCAQMIRSTVNTMMQKALAHSMRFDRWPSHPTGKAPPGSYGSDPFTWEIELDKLDEVCVKK